MRVKKFLKGLMAAALAVTMAVTPVTSVVKAAEVTVTSGASIYTFSETPTAAFLVTGILNDPIILYCLPEGAQVYSQPGSSAWIATEFTNCDYADIGVQTKFWRYDYDLEAFWDSSSETDQYFLGGARRSDGFDNNGNCIKELPNISFFALYHSDVPGIDSICVTRIKNDEDMAVMLEAFAYCGITPVQIPVADALAMDNATVQMNTTSTEVTQQTPQAQQTPQPENIVVSQGTYTVEANDNLSKIAQKVYGDKKAWKEIYKANPMIKGDYVIYKGQVLVIPAR